MIPFPTGSYNIDFINNLDGIPTLPTNRNALVPLIGGTLPQEVHTELCTSAVYGTYSETCDITSIPVTDSGIYLCELSGKCEDMWKKSQKIQSVILTPGVYGIPDENIENCDGYLLYSTKNVCEDPEKIKQLKSKGVRAGKIIK